MINMKIKNIKFRMENKLEKNSFKQVLSNKFFKTAKKNFTLS